MQTSKTQVIFFMLCITVLVMMLLGISLFLVYHYTKKRAIFSQNLSEMQSNFERNILAAKLEMQENTFQHISRELHDNISLSLCLMNLRLNTMELAETNPAWDQMIWMKGILSNVIENLNILSKGLNKDVIAEQGLIEATKIEIARIRKLNIFAIDLEITGEAIFMENEKEIVLFRIIQESLNNVLKHSKAKHVHISLNFHPSYLTITVLDDGIGMPSAEKLAGMTGNAGLLNMRARAEIFGGTMSILHVDQGTNLQFLIPT